MNRILQKFAAVLLVICLFALSACSEKQSEEATTPLEEPQGPAVTESVIIDGLEYQQIKDEVMGISFSIPKEAYENWTILYGPFNQDEQRQETAPVDGLYLQFMPMVVMNILLGNVQYYEETDWDAWMSEGKAASSITGCPTNEEIGREGGMVYIYSEPEPDESGMDDDTVKAYREMLDLLPTIKGSIQLIPRSSELKVSIPAFAAADLNGNPIDSTLFGDYQLVMLNFWATFCGPCIDEMPDLQQLSGSMPEGTLLAGVVGDALSDEYIDMAKDIAAETKVTYMNIVPDQALQEYIEDNISGYPTTIFIDSNGNIVGDVLIGKHSREEYEAELENRFSNLKEDTSNNSQSENSNQPENDTQSAAGNQPGNNKQTSAGSPIPSVNKPSVSIAAGPAPAS